MSIFQQICPNSNSSIYFWSQVENPFAHSEDLSIIHSSPLLFTSKLKKDKIAIVYLTENNLFFSNSDGTWYSIYIKWCLFGTFVEELENGQEIFGFTLNTYNTKLDFYTDDSEDLNKWIENLSDLTVMSDFELYYFTIKHLDSGNFGTIYLCQDLQTNEKFAVKKIPKSKLQNRKLLKCCYNEINIQKKLNHPNVAKLFRVFENNKEILLVIEYVKGENLAEIIHKYRNLAEKQVKKFTKVLLTTVFHLHELGIIHRDIKPENIMVRGSTDLLNFKIIDFGLACYADQNENLCAGSIGYMAPEMLMHKPYDTKVDIYALGVTVYALLTGYAVFDKSNLEELIELNASGKANFSSRVLRNFSLEARNFLKLTLCADSRSRPPASLLLSSEWFVQCISKPVLTSSV